MAGLDEAVGQQATPQGAANKAGVEQISYFQEITFDRYVKFVNPLDGLVFWIKSNMVRNWTALFNNGLFNGFRYDQAKPVTSSPHTSITVKGSLHYSVDTMQEEAEIYTISRVVFTAESEVEDLTEISPDDIWVASIDGIRFAFNSLSSFYQQAGLWHYTGNAVYADMETQLIDDAKQFQVKLVVSNSLPIWLAMNSYANYDFLYFKPPFKLFPSYLSPNNLRPPFATVHIVPDLTHGIGMTPVLDKTLGHTQLARDLVRITTWGAGNDDIMNFIDFVNQQSVNFDQIGILNIPIVRDEKRTQSELSTIAQKKTIEYEVSYYQQSARNIMRQLIEEVFFTYFLT